MATTSSGADPAMVNKIASHLKSQGIFDQFRRDCLEDVDTKPAYQNLRQKVEGYVSAFLAKVTWEPKLNKNQLRDSLRRQINQSEMLSAGVERIIEQVIEPKMHHVFRPQIEKIVDEFLGLEGNKNADSVKKDLASTPGWQGVSQEETAPVPPDLPPGTPTPAPPLPPSEPPAAPPEEPPQEPPEAPPETPPDSPPDDPEPLATNLLDSMKILQVGNSPSASSGRNTPSSTSSKGGETPSSLKKQLSGLSPTAGDVKADKKPVVDQPSEVLGKPAILGKSLTVKNEQPKNQGAKPVPSKDQGVKKTVPVKDQFFKSQPQKLLKKVTPGSKDSTKAAEKLKSITPNIKPVVSKPKPQGDVRREGQGTKPSERETDDFQAADKKFQQSSEINPPPSSELDQKPSTEESSMETISGDVAESKSDPDIKIEGLKSPRDDTQDGKQELRASPLTIPDARPTTPGDADFIMDMETADAENTATAASKGEDSDGESGLSDISVSSVHTSDLSSFDEDISSTSSSSSVDSSSEEETVQKRISLKIKRPPNYVYRSDSDSEVPSEVTLSTDTSRPASVASDKPPQKRSPKTPTATSRALALSRYHGDSEDEDSRQDRRKKAALAKEERARRRQLAKEEREKVNVENRVKRALDPETVEEMEESRKVFRKEEPVMASSLKTTKEQLKEQKMLEKKREVRRRRSLNKRYFSDEFSSSMQGLQETASQQLDEQPCQEVKEPELIPLKALIRKEKPKCFHLVYRERREAQVKCHHLLNQELSGEQQKKQSTRKRKERDSKVPRFSFAQAKAGTSGEGRLKQRSLSYTGTREIALKEKQAVQTEQSKEQMQQQQDKDANDHPCSVEEEPQTQQEQPCQSEALQEPSRKEQSPVDAASPKEEQIPPTVEKEAGELSMEVDDVETKMDQDVGNTVETVKVGDDQTQDADEPVQDFEKQEKEETVLQGIGQDETKSNPLEGQGQDKPEGEETQSCAIHDPVEKVQVTESLVESLIQDKVQEDEIKTKELVTESTTTIQSGELSQGSTTVLEKAAALPQIITAEDAKPPVPQIITAEDAKPPVPQIITAEDAKPPVPQIITAEDAKPPVPQIITAEDAKPPVPDQAPMETTGDDIDNPPTPTQDEPSIYSDAGSESEEQVEKGSSIPIYTVHSPKHLALGSVFKLSQPSLQDMKPVSSGHAETRTPSKDGDSPVPDVSEKNETANLQGEDSYQSEESPEGNADRKKQDPEAAKVVSESGDKASTSEASETSQPESRYGTRSKRQAVSPRDSLDDDYYYYGQPKRGRFSQSPISHQEEPGKVGRTRARRVSTDSGKSEGTSRESTDRPIRSSRQRHVSPPHRYSPSDTRTSSRRSPASPNPPAPNPPARPTRRGSSPSSHEHFTRRSSGREETKRGNRYSDMYYYNDRGSRNQASTRSGDRGRNPEPVSSRRSSRKSVEDRAGNQAGNKRRK